MTEREFGPLVLLGDERECPVCRGSGRVDEGGDADPVECPECDGLLIQHRCWLCKEWRSYAPNTHACRFS